jgi:hypothetical protein
MPDHQGRSETVLQPIAVMIVRRINTSMTTCVRNIMELFKRFKPRSTKLEDSLLFFSLASLDRK